jgi:hypothetical protein
MKYVLEIYGPRETDTVLINLPSTTPFMPIERGDLLDPRGWPDGGDLTRAGKALRVTDVEHIIQEGLHKIMVYTRAVDHTRQEIRWE